jgi:hypothetical protein
MLTQRPFAAYNQAIPTQAITKIETNHMMDGDVAGLAIFQTHMLLLGQKRGRENLYSNGK